MMKRILLVVLAGSVMGLGGVGESVAKRAKPIKINKRFLSPKLKANRWKDTFEKPSREIYKHRGSILSRLGIRKGQVIADIGAGTGAFLPSLRKAVGPKPWLYAVDISPSFVGFLKGRIRAQQWKRIRVVHSTITSTKLPTASVDVAFVCATYHHFGHVREMVTDIHRALRPGGRLVIIDYKRIPGVSSAWILKHVRWGQKTVIKQVIKYGFRLEKRIKVDGLKENYVMTFKRVKKK